MEIEDPNEPKVIEWPPNDSLNARVVWWGYCEEVDVITELSGYGKPFSAVNCTSEEWLSGIIE